MARAILIPLIFVAAANAAQADAANTALSRALELAGERSLSQERAWLRLGHWQTGWRGPRSQADGPRFFLAPRGQSDPAAELAATLKEFAAPLPTGGEDEHAQCRFPARRSWLFSTLGLEALGFKRLPCKSLTNWKRTLNARAVSIVFASAYLNNAASMFGHTFLKFQSAKSETGSDLLNYGVSYWANTGADGGIPFMLFGLMGGYTGSFSMNPFHETLKEYASLEGRDLWEYRLSLSPAETEILLDHLIELQQTHFDYFFFDENCASQILTALEIARPSLELSERFFYWVIPAETVRVIATQPDLVASVHYRPSLRTLFSQTTARLARNERDLVHELVLKKSATSFTAAQARLDSLPRERKVHVLSAALQYGDLLHYKREDVSPERLHRLRLLRARLAGPEVVSDTGTEERHDVDEAHAPSPPPPPPRDVFRPESGHDSARVGLGGGENEGEGFLHLEARAAYHDLLSDHRGYLKDSHLEILRLRARAALNDPRLSRLRLHEITLIDILSAAPSDVYFQPLAWRMDLGLQRLPDRDPNEPMAASLNGGVGYSFAPLNSRVFTLFTFAQGHADAAQAIERGYRLGASIEAQALVKPLHWLRFLAGARARRNLLGATDDQPSHWLKASATLSRNLELRLSVTKDGTRSEQQGLLFLHVLL